MRRKLYSLGLSLIALVLPAVAWAAAPAGNSTISRLQNAGSAAGISTSVTVFGIVSVVINILLSLVGLIFLILIIYGGYLWMTAGGDSDKVSKAKETFGRAAIGLVIIILAYSIANFIVPAIYCASNPGANGCTATLE